MYTTFERSFIMSKLLRISTTPERLRIALSNANMKQTELSAKTGLDKGSISCYLSGKYEPKSDAINKMAIALNVNEMWLWGYDVPMERDKKTPDTIKLTEGEEKWLMLYNKLSSETRTTLIEFAEVFEKMPTETRQFLLAGIRASLDNQK